MTPEQKIKWIILQLDANWQGAEINSVMCADEIEERYNELVAEDAHWDAMNQIRSGTAETGLPCPLSRNYEAKAVAAQAPDGSWVGWTYWYGGGKHSEPEAIDWMSEAYDLHCHEEEKTVVVQTFMKCQSIDTPASV